MAICTACLVGAVILGCSAGHVVQRQEVYTDTFKFKFEGLCKEMDCGEAQYSYHKNSCQGPNFWSKVTPCWSTCSSFHQSPVNILTDSTLYRPLGHLQFSNICERVRLKLTHRDTTCHCEPSRQKTALQKDPVGKIILMKEHGITGHAPHFQVDDNSTVTLCNVPHQAEHRYVFRDIHVHLGRTEWRGSEHAIDGAFSSMEVHLILMNAKYSSIREASQSPGGLAVIGVMVEIEKNKRKGRYGKRGIRRQKRSRSCGNTDVCRFKRARRLSYLMETYYKKIRQRPWKTEFGKQDKVTIDILEDISLNDILPYDLSYFTYHGSLTTPPCYETVQWIMMRCPVTLSREAFEAFGSVPDSQGHPLRKYGIRRPLQRGIVDHPMVTVERNFRCGSTGNTRNVCHRRG